MNPHKEKKKNTLGNKAADAHSSAKKATEESGPQKAATLGRRRQRRSGLSSASIEQERSGEGGGGRGKTETLQPPPHFVGSLGP